MAGARLLTGARLTAAEFRQGALRRGWRPLWSRKRSTTPRLLRAASRERGASRCAILREAKTAEVDASRVKLNRSPISPLQDQLAGLTVSVETVGLESLVGEHVDGAADDHRTVYAAVRLGSCKAADLLKSIGVCSE